MFRWVAAVVLVLGLVGLQTANAIQEEEELEFLRDRVLMKVNEDKKSEVSSPFSIIGKPTSQSTSHHSGKFPASKAVDGSGSSLMASCSHTFDNTLSPWWKVDLGGDHCISKVRILNRGDCCSDRLAGAVVRVGNNYIVTTNPACGSPVTAAQAQPLGGTIELDCSPALTARYISVNIPGRATLILCEVTVEQCVDAGSIGYNIVGKPTSQSSSHHSGNFPASNAVDGSGSSLIASCSHTVPNTESPWWRVDLGGDRCISKVRILNRGDCCSDRLEGAVVRVGNSDIVTNNPACGSPVTAAQAKPLGGTIELDCSPALTARYISVNIPGRATLQLCEVTVEQCAGSIGYNIVGKPTLQSSSHPNFPASNAVDGSGSSLIASCSHTLGHTINPWWRVDFEEEQCVTKVTILNRGDCCSDRLKGAQVRAGLSQTVAQNEACGAPVTSSQAQPWGGTVDIECGRPLRARYVSVDIPGIGTLQLCEVNVEVLTSGMC